MDWHPNIKNIHSPHISYTINKLFVTNKDILISYLNKLI